MDSILVVDDDRDVLRFMCVYLQEAGYPVLGCDTAEAARMLSGPFSMAIIDYSLERGPDAYHLSSAWRIPILFVTGHGRHVEGHVLRKPFTRAEFVHAVQTILGEPT